MIDIRKLSLPLLMLGPLIGGAAAAGGSYAANKAQITQVEERAEKTEKRTEALEKSQNRQAVQNAETQVKLEYMQKALDRIEDKLGTKR